MSPVLVWILCLVMWHFAVPVEVTESVLHAVLY